MKSQSFFFISGIIILAILLIGQGCQEQKQNSDDVILTGTITNPTGDSVELQLYPVLGWDNDIFKAGLDESGNFEHQFSISEPMPASFSDGNEVTYMYLLPGDRINLMLDTEQFDETIRYSGRGSEKNNYLAQKYLQFEDPRPAFWQLADSLSAKEYKRKCLEYKNRKAEFLEVFLQSYSLPEEFVNYQNTENEFQYASNLFYFISRNSDYQIPYDTIHVPSDFYSDYEDVLEFVNPDQRSREYNNFISTYSSFVSRVMPREWDSRAGFDSFFFAKVLEDVHGITREKIIASHVYSNLNAYLLEGYEKHRDLVDASIKWMQLKSILEKKYIQVKEELSRPRPENTNMTDLNEETYKDIQFQDILNKYKGKVVYLDFWASWCGPCRGEMPYSLDLQSHFADQDVAFVYISSDAGYEEWERMIRILQITGDHYRTSKAVRSEYNQLFNVRFIPRYVLYDKDGNVVDSTALRPSNPDIIDAIEQLL
jgi:thiol-disulfide isomerase/thioredoxin